MCHILARACARCRAFSRLQFSGEEGGGACPGTPNVADVAGVAMGKLTGPGACELPASDNGEPSTFAFMMRGD